MRIAFLGTGLMGAHQVRRLLQAGHSVCAWNRSIDKAQALVADGASVAATPAEAVTQAEVVCVMLENGDVVQQVLLDSGAAQALAQTSPGAVVVDTSSIKPAQARQHALQLHALGLQHIDAPVSGGVSAAEAGSLAIMAGGDEAVFARVQPLLSAMGRATHVGPHGAGQLAKLANQMIVAVNIAAVAEALQMAAAGGADPAKVRDAIRGGFAESRVLELHGQRMVDGDFTPRARATMQLKDLHNAQEVAQDTGFIAPTVNTVTALFEGLVEREGEIDHSGLWREIAHINGLTAGH